MITVKIPLKAPSVLITKLRKRGNHVKTGKALVTNQATRIFGFYFALKALTTSGQILDYPKQMDSIHAITGVNSYAAVLYKLRQCERFKLLTLDTKAKRITLCSWAKCLDILGIHTKKEDIKFIHYDFEDEKTPLPVQYLVELAEVDESKYFVKKAIVKQVNQNNELVKRLKPQIKATEHPADTLFNLQIDSFIDVDLSEVDYTLLHSVQSCPDRSVASMIEARKNGKTIRATQERIAYFKRKINASGIAQVTPQVFTSNKRKRANNEFFYRGWCKKEQKPMWYLPDSIQTLAYVA